MSHLKIRRQPPIQAKIGVAMFILFASFCVTHHTNIQHCRVEVVLSTIIISAFFLFSYPIPQPQSYHNFADKRVLLCSCHSIGLFLPSNEQPRGVTIPNAGDVISNTVILTGGLLGVMLLSMDPSSAEKYDWTRNVCLPLLFYSTILISVGSTYYHWKPTDQSLVWDRLPMTIAFVSMFCFIMEEYTSLGIGPDMLFPLIGVGVFSIIYWRWTDDLRLYAVVQFFPLLVIALLIVFGDPKHGGRLQHALALLSYLLAKYCEDRDYEIFELTEQRVSGHSLKHVLAGFASVFIATTIYA